MPALALRRRGRRASELHREEGWGEKIRGLFAPEDADRMYNACRDLLERLETAIKRHNSTGDALAEIVAAFSPNGLMGREVLAPASRAAEKIAIETEVERKDVDGEKPTATRDASGTSNRNLLKVSSAREPHELAAEPAQPLIRSTRRRSAHAR